MIEVCLALSGISTAIASFLPNITRFTGLLIIVVAGVASVIGFFSAYTALLLLAGKYNKIRSMLGFTEIRFLLFNPEQVQPYWFLAWVIFIWLIFSFFLGLLVISGGAGG
jgi:hypothetical protein